MSACNVIRPGPVELFVVIGTLPEEALAAQPLTVAAEYHVDPGLGQDYVDYRAVVGELVAVASAGSPDGTLETLAEAAAAKLKALSPHGRRATVGVRKTADLGHGVGTVAVYAHVGACPCGPSLPPV